MSLKDLFIEENIADKSLVNASPEKLVNSSDLESADFLRAYTIDKKRIIPDLDLSDPKNFARFGRAELYYDKAFEYIQNYYPYDGSAYEKLAFQNSGSILDMYILDKEYPKATGYVSFGKDINYDGSATTFKLKNTTSPEYIFFQGGPNAPLSGYTANDDIALSKGNVYDEEKLRTSNLSLNMASGSTIEFWMKKGAFAGSSGEREIIFDLWNSASISDTGPAGIYARLNVSCIQSSTNVITFFHQSGNVSHTANLDTGLTTVADDSWHHYSITAANNGSDLFVDLFVDGKHKAQSKGTSKATSAVTGAMQATLGAAVFQMNGDSAGGIGYGKLSGSLDDFRYWKKTRTSKEVQRNWSSHVAGGTNTDDANTSLGVYYKFNEGITGTGSYDQVALDYSGRISNGTFTGYDASFSRSTGSAFEESGNNLSEQKDPIIYSFHPSVVEKIEDLKSAGKAHDHQNTSLLQSMVPSWIIDEEVAKDDVVMQHLIQVLSFYFDELSMQITTHKDIKNVDYVSGSLTGSFTRPSPFSRRLLSSHGFIAPEIFTQAEHFEMLQDKNDDFAFSGSLDEIKNIIYGNIYNNLNAIQKSKGTARSIKNLLHCVGIDQDLFKINLYSSGAEVKIQNNFKTKAVKTRLLDFGGHEDRQAGTAYQYTDASNANSQNYITGTFQDAHEASIGYSVEAEIIFPTPPEPSTKAAELRHFLSVSSSLFGQHTAEDNLSGNDLTFKSTDHSHFSVFAVKPETNSPDAKIVVTGSEIGTFETENIRGLYDGGKYNIVFSMTPGKQGFNNARTGSESAALHGGMTASILVTSTTYDKVTTLVTASSGITATKSSNFLKHNKRVYAGAHYTNFTSSLLHKSDVKINSLRVWLNNLDQETIIAHNRDLLTYGPAQPNKLLNTNATSLQGVEVPAHKSLALHWNFSANTGSDASGQMLILDESSGSSAASAYGWLGTVSDNFHTARADFFPASSENSIDIDYINTARQSLPEVVDSDDMTQILSGSDDVIFTRESRPVDYVFSIEKSFYQSISEELLNFFATIDDFHSLIGQPVNRYRQEYKDLGKLRQLLFERFEQVDDIEKYVTYYKWFDSSIIKMVENLIPASARFTKGASNIVESHVLERNKYWNKFPTLEMRHDPPEGTIKGREELKYNWRFGGAPLLQAASASLVLISNNPAQHNTKKFQLVSIDETTKTYTFFNSGGDATGDLNSGEVVIQLNGLSSEADFTTEVAAAVTGSSGHNNKIKVRRTTTTDANDTVIFTQNASGALGNTPITLTSFIALYQTMNGGVTNTFFQGGTKEDTNCLWWRDRAERNQFRSPLSSSNAAVNTDRQTIVEAVTTDVSGSGTQLVKYNTDGSRTKYQAFRYGNRSLLRHQDFIADHLNSPNRRNKPHENKKYTYWRAVADFRPGSLERSLAVNSVNLLDPRKDCADQDDIPTSSAKHKFKYSFVTTHNIEDDVIENTEYNGRITFPFSLYSGSNRPTGTDLDGFKTDIEINNLHHDQVHPRDSNMPMQSPFTEHHVGGNFYRHTDINDGTDTFQTRTEGWGLKISDEYIHLVHAGHLYNNNTPRVGIRFREETAKRPLNIKNILVTTASNQGSLGNYSKGYQIFQSSNRKTNDLWFRSGSDGTGGFTFNEMQSPFISGTYDYKLPVRTRNEHIFVERFSAPGGAEVMSRGHLDPESEQYSVYNSLNNRNLLLRRVLQGTSGSLLSNHTIAGGFDSYYGSPTASFHKTHRNTQHSFKKVPVVVSVTFNSVADPSDLENFELTLTSSNGVARAYKFEDGSGGATGDSQGSGVITVQLNGLTSRAHMASQLKIAINDSSGHGTDGDRLTVVLATTAVLNDTVVIAQVIEQSVLADPSAYTGSLGVVHANDPQGAQGDLTVNGVDPTLTATAFMVNEDIYKILPFNTVLPMITVPVKKYDNGHIQHAIPTSERQSSWITASIKDHALGASAPLGYQQPDNKPYASGTFTFLSQSSLTVSSNAVANPPLNFAGLNVLTRDPITAGTNTLGFPLTADMQEYHTALAEPGNTLIAGNASRFLADPGRLLMRQKFDGVTMNHIGNGRYARSGSLNHVSGAPTGSATLHALLLRRNGPSGYSSWKQIRTGEHPIARFNRKNNIITTVTSSRNSAPAGQDKSSYDYMVSEYDHFQNGFVTNNNIGLRRLIEPPVTVNKAFTNVVNGIGPSQTIAYSHTNDNEYFTTHYYNKNLLNASQMSRRTLGYSKMLNLHKGTSPFGDNSPLTIQTIKYQEVIYPKKRFTFLSGTRGRDSFEVEYWRDSRFDRSIPAHFFTNSMGMTLAASGSTDGTPSGLYTENLTSGYGLVGAASSSIAAPNSSIWPLDGGLGGGNTSLFAADGGQYCDTTAYRSALLSVASATTTYASRRIPSLKPVADTTYRSGLEGWGLPECADSGELQAAYQIYHMGEFDASITHGTAVTANALLDSPSSSIRIGQLINRRIPERRSATTEYLLAGDTKWEVAEQAKLSTLYGKDQTPYPLDGPFYQTYSDYAEDIRLAGKDFTIIPEYRQSEYVGYYALSQSGDISSINTPNQLAFLSLTGSSYSSAENKKLPDAPNQPRAGKTVPHPRMDFIQRYSTADFMKMFSIISEDFEDTELGSPVFNKNGNDTKRRAPSKLTLKCNALMKFLPYEGFFPMQRAMQLGSIFNASYGDSIKVTGDRAHKRTLINPFFAPGIMYNSLKSGIACDYPVFTAPTDGADDGQGLYKHGFRLTEGSGARVLNDNDAGRKTSGSFDHRIPWEAILAPNKFLGSDDLLIDQEPHPSASINSTASLAIATNDVNPTYTLAAHNYFSEIVNFYLKDSQLTTIEGAPDSITHNQGETFANEDGDYFGTVNLGLLGLSGEAQAPFIVKTFSNNDEDETAETPKEYRMRVVLRNSLNYQTPGQYAFYMTGTFPEIVVSGNIQLNSAGGCQGITASHALGPLKAASYTTYPFQNPEIAVYERTGSHPQRFLLPNPTGTYAPKASVLNDVASRNFVRGSSYGPAHSYTVVPGSTSGFKTLAAGGLNTISNYSPYTPPYFNGLAYVELVYRPENGGYVALDQILGENITQIDRRVTEVFNLAPSGSTTDENASYLTTGSWIANENHNDAMHLASSVDILKVKEVKKPLFDFDGNIIGQAEESAKKVVFNPKFECPIFDYSNAPVTLPTYGSGSVVRGTWHQYGDYSSSTGVKLEIQDIPTTEMRDSERTGSLADLLGIDKGNRSKRIGKIAQSRKVSEAVVAIPFIINESGKEEFFPIEHAILSHLQENYKGNKYDPRDWGNAGASLAGGFSGSPEPENGVDGELVNLIEKMRKYVFPPKFSWIDPRLTIEDALAKTHALAGGILDDNRPFLDPMVMYVFEFEHEFNEKDMKNMWHNISPPSLLDVKDPRQSEVTISHSLLPNALFGPAQDRPNSTSAAAADLVAQLTAGKKTTFRQDIQWMVFKVKQRAKTDYAAVTPTTEDSFKNDLSEGDLLRRNPARYSYNWPYDYFSMVEMVKIEETLEFSNNE